MKTHVPFILLSMIFGAGIHAQIIHVPAAQPSIQAGIEAASNGDTVVVADGTYLENINLLGKAITVASHYILDGDTNHINNTIIDGSHPDDPDYGSVVTFITGEDSTSVICGFTITGGSGMYLPVYDARIGGGIVCFGAAVKILHNKIQDNVLSGSENAWGSGIASINYTCDPWTVIEYNLISGNSAFATVQGATGGGIEVWGNVRIRGNVIENNICQNPGGGSGAGGGVLVTSPNDLECSLHFIENIVRNNLVETNMLSMGGGLSVQYSRSIITNNEFYNNTISGTDGTGGGLDFRQTASLILEYNRISDNNIIMSTNNIWFGAGLYVATPEGECLIKSNEIADNSGTSNNNGRGGGMYLGYALENQVIVDGNRIHNNNSFRGGGFYEESSYNLRITNNLFLQNSGTGNGQGRAGGLVINNMEKGVGQSQRTLTENTLIVNNTFISNSADERGGALRFNGALCPPVIYNCIFWDNSAPLGKDIDNATAVTIEISYSDLETAAINGYWYGTGNIFADPLFLPIDPFYHLSSSSPCIDTGIQNLQTPFHDYDGESRPDPVNWSIDMGADEFYDLPAAPIALIPEDIGLDYFVAIWTQSLWAIGYSLDVAYDANFIDIVPGYDNLDVGKDTLAVVSGLGPGDYFFRARAYNALWTSDNSNTVEVLGVGTNEVVLSSEFSVMSYPNPSKGIVDCQFGIVDFQRVTVKVYDVHGREVMNVLDQKLPAGEHTVCFDLSVFPAGIYFLSVTTGDEHIIQKLIHSSFIIQH